MASPPSDLHRATATSTPLRAGSTEADARCTRGSTASAYETAPGALARSSPGQLKLRRRQFSVAGGQGADFRLRVNARHARSHALPHMTYRDKKIATATEKMFKNYPPKR
jgi:hypothetical protein